MIEQAMTIRIKPSDIKFLVSKVTERHEENLDTSFDVQAVILMERFGHKPNKIFAILSRIRCLIALMGNERMRGWTLHGQEPGCTLTHEAVFDATATCRLQEKDNHFFFDPDEFFELALRYTEPESRS